MVGYNPPMLPYNSWVSRIAFGLFFVFLIGYGYFEVRALLYGPQITVPDVVEPVHESFVRIQGMALHIASLTMNGRPISVTESGEFNEPYLLAPGTNRITLDAKDKYGNATRKIMQVVYVPLKSTTPPRTKATSTPSTATTSATSSSSTTPLAH